jgi:hypothetical protein
MYSTLLFSLATQTCCLEAEEDMEYFGMVFQVSDCPRSIASVVMVSFRCNASESVRLSVL